MKDRMTREVINYLYKHCLIGRKDRQMIHLIYQTVREKVNILGKQSTFLFFLSRDRKDFREQFQMICYSCREDKCMLQAEIRNEWNFCNIGRTMKAMLMYLKGRRVLKRNRNYQGLSLTDWFWISMMYARYEMYQKAFAKFDFSHSKFLVTYGEWMPEVAALSYANSQGLTTIVNVQGMYSLVEKRQYPNYPKVVFVWGERDKKLLYQNRPDMKIYVCGTPQIRRLHIQEETQLLGIALGAHENHRYNQKIIDIAEEYARKYGMKIRLRLHPGDNIKEYRIDYRISEENRDLDRTKFVIVHKTTMCITYMRQGKLVCAYEAEKDEMNLKIDPRFFFHDLISLEQAVARNQGYDFISYATSFIRYIDDDAVKEYGKIFHMLNEKIGVAENKKCGGGY